MHKSDEYKESRDEAYVKSVVSQLKERPIEKKAVSTVQAASTQRIIDRTPEQEAKRLKEIADQSYWIDLKEKSRAPHPHEAERRMSPQEFQTIELARRSAKNSIGQSELSSASSERKELARQAYSHTPATELTEAEKQKITQLKEIKQIKEIPKEEPKEGGFKRSLHRAFSLEWIKERYENK